MTAMLKRLWKKVAARGDSKRPTRQRRTHQDTLDEMGRRMRANPLANGLDECFGNANGPKLKH
jgi:hypothetical protein